MASITLNPSAYVSCGATTGTPTISSQTTPVGKGSSNTTYAQLTTVTTTNSTSYAFWKFDCSSIPSTATIDSVSCIAKIGVSSTTTTRTASRSVQLYNGTSTAKGSSVSWTASTTGSTATISSTNAGTWTRSELDNIHIRIASTRGTSTQTLRVYFYGADLTINYTEANVQHTITISSTGDGTTSPLGDQTVTKGDPFTVSIVPSNSTQDIKVTDNSVDVSSSVQTINANEKYYEIASVDEDHIIVVQYINKYNVSITVNNGTLLEPENNPTEVNGGSNLSVTASANENTKFSSMEVNGVKVTPSIIKGQNTTAATWSISTNYSTYSGSTTDINSDTSTYWWSGETQGVGKYVLVTFNKYVNLNSFSTYSSNSTDYPHSCNKLQVSADNKVWTDVGTFADAQTSTFNNINAEKIKYVRIYSDTSGVSNWLVLNTITMNYDTPAIVGGYNYTITNINEEQNVVITFASNSKVTIKVGGSWRTGTSYVKENGVWVEKTPKELATYVTGKHIINKKNI